MRYAILSDVHANEAALRAVLTDAADLRAEKIVCLGDVLGYGPDPVSALELVYRTAHVCLAGNHDDAVANRFPVEDFTDFAATAVARHRAALTQEALDWLRRLPYTCEFEGFACAHGDFSDPKNFNYVLDAEDALPSWAERKEQLLFVGHTHQPCIFVIGASGEPHRLEGEDFALEDGKRYIVNPGSVGYPRSGTCRSGYCIYDDVSRTVFFRSLPFDLEAYAAKMHGQGLDEAPWMAARAQERRRPAVRNTAVFGKKAARRSVRGKTAMRKPASAVTAPVAPGIGKPDGTSWTFAIVLAAVVLAIAGLMCTVRLVNALPKTDARQEVARLQIAETAAAAPVEARAFTAAVPLSGGWTAAFEDPSEQRVRIERNARRNETVFRIEHAAVHTVRFEKKISLMAKPARLYQSVELLTPARPGVKVPFQFVTRVVFRDASGRVVGSEVGSGKRSARNRGCDVPPTAEEAVFTVDCRCEGTFDLDVPYVGMEPQRPSAPRKRR